MAESKYVAWLRQCYPDIKISPLGEKVANLLGLAYSGIYHLEGYQKIKWAENYCFVVWVYAGSLATYDNDRLTRMVFLAHELGVRLEIAGSRPHYIKLHIHNREERTGPLDKRHPTLDQAVANFHKNYDEEIAQLTGQAVQPCQ
jgi:hypothetical protein